MVETNLLSSFKFKRQNLLKVSHWFLAGLINIKVWSCSACDPHAAVEPVVLRSALAVALPTEAVVRINIYAPSEKLEAKQLEDFSALSAEALRRSHYAFSLIFIGVGMICLNVAMTLACPASDRDSFICDEVFIKPYKNALTYLGGTLFLLSVLADSGEAMTSTQRTLNKLREQGLPDFLDHNAAKLRQKLSKRGWFRRQLDKWLWQGREDQGLGLLGISAD
ncbi:hypothetical protein [Candidatus Odyssella thessalonicensis]|uniref:hypothetical protein n=1 Tax=Candidatus Odyssella thessalonicensis TaxID=84647 RepID=UPI000225BEB6|nr:hypothetical protein [Candidatus Odyssella thessalonicensis]